MQIREGDLLFLEAIVRPCHCASCDVGDASPGTFGIWLLDTSLSGVLFVFGSAILPYVGSVGGFGVP